MKISEGMYITIVDARGNEVSEGFIVSDDASREDVNNEEKMLKFARNMLNEYFDCKEALEKFEQKMLDNCTCSWKDKPEEERVWNRCHNSECATWEME